MIGVFNCTTIGEHLIETNITIEIFSNNSVKISTKLTTLSNYSDTTIEFRQFDSEYDMKQKTIEYLNYVKEKSINGVNKPVPMGYIENICSMTALEFETLRNQKLIQLTTELRKLDDFIEELSV